jgi:membrane protease YdiL (CAAX protease family)
VSIALDRAHLVDKHDVPVGAAGLYAFLLLPFAAMGLTVLGWVRLVERRSLATIGLARAHGATKFLRGWATGVGMTWVIVAAVWVFHGYEVGAFGAAIHSPRSVLHAAVLLVCFGLQSSVEEMVFRGWLLSVIARKLGVVLGVLLSSLVFALLHYEGTGQPPIFTLNTLVFAIFACAWAMHRRSVWEVMGWHAGWNWMFATGFELPVTALDAHVSALLVRLTPNGSTALTGGAEGPEGSVACTLVLIAGVTWVAYRTIRARTR